MTGRPAWYDGSCAVRRAPSALRVRYMKAVWIWQLLQQKDTFKVKLSPVFTEASAFINVRESGKQNFMFMGVNSILVISIVAMRRVLPTMKLSPSTRFE